MKWCSMNIIDALYNGLQYLFFSGAIYNDVTNSKNLLYIMLNMIFYSASFMQHVIMLPPSLVHESNTSTH